jgi:hypothetical protein
MLFLAIAFPPWIFIGCQLLSIGSVWLECVKRKGTSHLVFLPNNEVPISHIPEAAPQNYLFFFTFSNPCLSIKSFWITTYQSSQIRPSASGSLYFHFFTQNRSEGRISLTFCRINPY